MYLKNYKRGLPCKLGGVVGRIIGESGRGIWFKKGNNPVYSLPIWVTPYGSKCIPFFDTLTAVTAEEERNLNAIEHSLTNHGITPYAKYYSETLLKIKVWDNE